jgi:acyl-CoA dehydrogenase
MSEIRSMLEDTITKLMKDQCTKELITEAEKGVFPILLWNTLDELGVTAVGIDEDKGGSGGDLGDLMALLKITGYYAAPIPLTEHILANWLLSSVGVPIEPELCTFGQVLKDDEIDFMDTKSGWVISGKTSYVPWARNAKYVTVVGKGNDGTLFVANVPLDQCTINQQENLAGEPRDEVLLNEITVDKEVVGQLEPHHVDDFLDKATLTRVMLMTGALERTLDLTVTYSKERTQFGRPIGKFQAIQQQLAILAGETTASMVVADYIMNTIDDDLSFDEVAMAKIQLGDATEVATRIAHQVHAAMGFTDEHPLHQSTRRLWSWRDEFGTETILAQALGEKVLEDASEDLWKYITNPKVLS